MSQTHSAEMVAMHSPSNKWLVHRNLLSNERHSYNLEYCKCFRFSIFQLISFATNQMLWQRTAEWMTHRYLGLIVEYSMNHILFVRANWMHLKWNQDDFFFFKNWIKRTKEINDYLKLTIPIREIVAGDACIKSCVSKIKCTLSPNWIRQPDGNVKSLPKCIRCEIIWYKLIYLIMIIRFFFHLLIIVQHRVQCLHERKQKSLNTENTENGKHTENQFYNNKMERSNILQSNPDQFPRRI